MDELISRQAAIDAICKACSLEGDYHKCDGYPETSTWCDELVALRALPSVQPEIIRCNSCKYWTQSTGKMTGHGLGRCDFHDADLVTCNGFCYWAERQNNE